MYIPKWNEYERGKVMGNNFSRVYLGQAYARIDEIKILFMQFSLHHNVISNNKMLRDLVLNADEDGYLALYNNIVLHNPNLTLKNKVRWNIRSRNQSNPVVHMSSM